MSAHEPTASLLADPVAELRGRARAWSRDAAGERLLLVRSAAAVAPERLLALVPEGDGLLWSPPDGPSWAGAGDGLTLAADGPVRFETVRRDAEALWPRLQVESLAEFPPPAPRLFGGFAFQCGGADADAWQAFGDARFLLPRFSYARDAERAWLGLALSAEECRDEAQLDRWLDRWERLIDALGAPDDGAAPPPARIVSESTRPQAEWEALVESIRSGIAAGSFEKVVAARRVELTLEPAPSLPALLAQLGRVSPECTRFAFRRGDAVFLGATPERLLSRRGLTVETEALAGSIRAGGPATASRLLASGKDHHEHELVVRDVLRCLSPLARSLEYSGQPRVQSLRHVLHLRTPVHAELREPHHVLDLVSRLHPTPAVGGVPRDAALEWIASNEPDARGWYAGPVGWFDAQGDGEFAVALRSGLLRGDRIQLHAGAGIVADSDAASEFAETRLKLAALLDALTGAEADPTDPSP